MDVELRPVTPDEHREFTSVMEGAFGSHVSEEAREDYRTVVEFDRTIAVFEGAEMVATAGAYTMELTLPGGKLERTAGVTYVGVRNTHRRRGLLRAMMDHQIDDIAERGECLAALTASEGSIYRRFGYGPASFQANWRLPTGGTTFARRPDTGGRLRQITRSEAEPVIPGAYERCRTVITGAINRTPAWWAIYFKDAESERDGASARFYVIHESAAGEVDGCLAFRQRRSWDHGLAGNTIVVDELYGTTPEVEAALWAHVIDHDLVGTVEAPGRPVDDPIRWWLNDPRRLTCTSLVDALWVRPLDIARTLAARTYPVADALVFGISRPVPACQRRHLPGRRRAGGCRGEPEQPRAGPVDGRRRARFDLPRRSDRDIAREGRPHRRTHTRSPVPGRRHVRKLTTPLAHDRLLITC
jgi:predicted acetyltransferase